MTSRYEGREFLRRDLRLRADYFADMASLCQEAARIPPAVADVMNTRCRTGNATEPLVATREGCATVAHADIRGLDTSRQIYVAGLPSL